MKKIIFIYFADFCNLRKRTDHKDDHRCQACEARAESRFPSI